MLWSASVTRRGLIIGGAGVLGLAACGSLRQAAIAPAPVSTSPDYLYDLMRKTGVRAFRHDGNEVVLPEFRSTLAGFRRGTEHPAACLQSPDAVGLHPSVCATAPPVIYTATVPCNCGNVTVTYTGDGTFGEIQAIWYGLEGVNPTAGAIFAIGATAPQCLKSDLAAVASAATTIANAIKYAGSYAANLREDAGWFLDGAITMADFFALLLAECGVGELLGLLAGAGVTLYAVYSAIQCAADHIELAHHTHRGV